MHYYLKGVDEKFPFDPKYTVVGLFVSTEELEKEKERRVSFGDKGKYKIGKKWYLILNLTINIM